MPYCFEFHSRSLYNKINWVHEHCSRIIYYEKRLNFEDNSKFKDNSASTHCNNTNSLATEMCEVFHAISPEIMGNVFQIRNNTHYNTRHAPTFLTEPIHNVLMVVSQYPAWDPEYGSKYLITSKWEIPCQI